MSKNINFSFPKLEKLCKLAYIEKLFSEGKSLQGYPLKIIYVPIDNNKNVTFQVLVSVPKRSFKKAVHRNRIKRLIRESYRLQKHMLEGITKEKYALAIIFTGKEVVDYQTIFKSTATCLEKFKEVILTSE